jgi:hypothetical protein
MVGFGLGSETVRDGDSERGKGAAVRAVAGREGGWSAPGEADPDVRGAAVSAAAMECRNATMGIRERQVDVGIFLTSEVLSRPGIGGTPRCCRRELPDSRSQ